MQSASSAPLPALATLAPGCAPLPAGDVKGTYALEFLVQEPLAVQIGRLGLLCVGPGCLVYVGSALGAGGLKARLQRHLRPDKRLHWHIDYLTAQLQPVDWWLDISGQRLECAWVQHLLALPFAVAPLAGLGSGDCRQGCPAHLLFFAHDRPTSP